MHRLPSLSNSSSSKYICARCIRQQTSSHSFHRRQSTFLASTRIANNQPSQISETSSPRRNLSQFAGVDAGFSTPTWNALMPPTSSSETGLSPFQPISQDALDKIFDRWQPVRVDQGVLSPTLDAGDPQGVQKYLIQGSSVPKTTVDLLTVLDALIDQNDLPRAATVLASLRRVLEPSTPLSTLVHNKYLQGIVGASIEKSAGVGKAMDWYQEMIDNGVKADRTTFALLSKAAFMLASVTDGNRAARKIFGLWRSQGGDIGDLLCDLMFPQEEILRSLKLNKMTMEDITEIHRTVLEIVVKTVQQTQTVLPDSQPSRISVPAVRQTLSKSPNLAFMRKSLECLYSTDKSSFDKLSESLTPGESAEIFENHYDMDRQRQLEVGAYTSALEVWKYEMAEARKRGDVYAGRLGIQNLAWDWVQAMKPVVEAHIERLRPKHLNGDGKEIWPGIDKDTEANRMDYVWLTALPVETLCAITIMEILRCVGGDTRMNGCKAGPIIISIGRAIEREIKASDLVRKENRGLLPKNLNLRQLFAKRTRAEQYAAAFHRELVNGTKEGQTYWPFEWNVEVRTRCTALLLSTLLETATAEMVHTDEQGKTHRQIAPAFYHTYAYVLGKKVGMIKPNRYIAKRMASLPEDGRGLALKLAPMLVPPKRWTSWEDGGYWYTREEVMRTGRSLEQKLYLKEASETNLLGDIYRGLDILGETCWTVNKKIFDVVLQVWNTGESIADIPPQPSDFEYPVQPKESAWDVKVRMEWIQECRRMSRAMQNAHSVRCDITYKLEIARAFIGQKLYFPHSLDFRGRAYPVPPHFNHLGNDLCRGLLLFYEGKPLGDRGLRWLKVHLANVYGLDKMRLDEREAFADNSMEYVFDSADHPLDGKRWWLNADDPWQCLATCMELAAAVRSEDPAAYVCRLPIHQDGSCNGLQHYAALGGDIEGARQVNLDPADRPQDVYSGVAELVAADIERQALEGNDIAKALQGKISRKIVKQTVMTSVYGVTFIGAKAQIYRALKDKGEVDDSLLVPASDVITRSTFKCLQDMFKGAHEIQEWLKECAKRITKSLSPEDIEGKAPSTSTPRLHTVIWTSPLGLPVCQPYRKVEAGSIQTLMTNIFILNPNKIGPVNVRKQMSAFPPNFIHSLDASHMLMSAIACNKVGLTFAAVHDSFWTHASDVDMMNVVLREAFIKLHSSDLVERLRNDFMERYKGHIYPEETENKKVRWKPLEFPPVPKKGGFDVKRLQDSIYFFS